MLSYFIYLMNILLINFFIVLCREMSCSIEEEEKEKIESVAKGTPFPFQLKLLFLFNIHICMILG